MTVFPWKCGINGCTKSKMKKHVHFEGELRNFGDRELVESYRVWAQMRGESIQIPGGSADDMAHYMTKKMRMNRKQAIEFRKRASRELDEARKNKQSQKKKGFWG